MGEIEGIVGKDEARAKANKLPKWVKCMVCGGRPKQDDWLFDIMAQGQGQQSNALIHMSCARGQGKFAGLNLGKGD